jgi:predicted RNA binding protein YcfA (HicA-like mRNA interferase family)
VKLPRDVSGDKLVKHLRRHWGYTQVNQVGSHVILVSDSPRHHRLPVPLHDPLGISIFKKILNEVCEAKNITQDELLRDL